MALCNITKKVRFSAMPLMERMRFQNEIPEKESVLVLFVHFCILKKKVNK